MADTQFDLIVIGGGPGGYVAAIRAAQLGLKTAVVEREHLGGICLNWGCIPTKALLRSSEVFHLFHRAAEFGIAAENIRFDVTKIVERSRKVAAQLSNGVKFLMKKNKVTYVKGAGRIAGSGRVDVDGADGVQSLQTRHIVIATGSAPTGLPGIEIDEERVVSSTGALALPKVPKRMIVIGGGVIGLELGSVWRRLGSQVSVVEYLDRIVPTMDGEVSSSFLKILKKQGMIFELGQKVVSVDKGKNDLKVTIEPAAGGAKRTLEADVVLVSIGRRPYTDELGLDSVGIAVDKRGFVPTEHWRTSAANVWAIGDVTYGPMLAHKAEEEGGAVAQLIAGQWGHVNPDIIPNVIYTNPEVASVGKTEEELKAAGVTYKVGKFPFLANSRARTNHEADGFVKILEDDRTKRVVGAHMIGVGVGELIGEVCVAMEFGASAEDVARTCHAHPSLNEAVKEAALAVAGRPIHI